jgi:hypothetical protein
MRGAESFVVYTIPPMMDNMQYVFYYVRFDKIHVFLFLPSQQSIYLQRVAEELLIKIY